MARWDPDAEGRLRTAALELFIERGYEQTTVAEIAEHAGLTSRTFFRYFADKREVLFSGSERLLEIMVNAAHAAPADATAMEMVIAALDGTLDFFADNRDFACRRSSVVTAYSELRERELIKLAKLADALKGALRDRGIPESDANLAAESGLSIFRLAFELWVKEGERRTLGELISELALRLQRVVAGQ